MIEIKDGTRRAALPGGWYPRGAGMVEAALGRWEGLSRGRDAPPGAIACVLPHAGWRYSGWFSCLALSALARDAETVVLVGGHLGKASPVIAAAESAFEGPLGPIVADIELLRGVCERIDVHEDRTADNSVEVNLPFLPFLFPGARALWFRAPPSDLATGLGRAVAEAAGSLGRKAVLAGATDLTHYGAEYYGFAPKGGGIRALEWVTGVNDRAFIERCLAMDGNGAVAHANAELSACSSGAAAAAIAFAAASGATKSELLAYGTSLDAEDGEWGGYKAPGSPTAPWARENFVGYCAIAFS